MLYLGGQDIDTARLISERANKPLHSILSMPLNKAYLFIRGREPIYTEKYEVQDELTPCTTPSPSMEETNREYGIYE